MIECFLTADTRKKYAAAAKPFTIDLKTYLRIYWIAGRRYASGDLVRSQYVPGFAYQQTGPDGEAGGIEPPWSRTLGGTAPDGSLTWTAIAVGINALDPIASVVWSQISPPDGALTIDSETNTPEEATAVFEGGTVGRTYRVQAAFTTASGKVYIVKFDLEVG